jgi:hypothetical protein
MADSIPQSYLKEIITTLAAEPLYVALFSGTTLVGYDPTSATNTYTTLAAANTQVGATGGYALTCQSANYSSTGAMLTATTTTIAGVSFTCRWLVFYEFTGKKIRFIKDLLTNTTVTSGTLTLVWSATDGLIKFTYTPV